jgi:hypothetical protein
MKQQVQIIEKVRTVLVPSKKRHKIIVGGRSKGASWSIARILLLEGMSNPLFIVCVREVQKTIKHSVYKLLADTIKKFSWEWHYTVMDNEIRGRNGTLFAFYGLRDSTSDNIRSMEGADRCWVAEAQTISRRSINSLRPTIRKKGSVFWWDFNPRYESDPVYTDYILNEDPTAIVLWLTWRDNPWITQESLDEKDSDYLRNPEEAKHIWEGAVRSEGEMYVCPATSVMKAMKAEVPGDATQYIIGADIAHQGGDEITFYKRLGFQVVDQYHARYQSTVDTAKALSSFAEDPYTPINIDNGSIGAAVADMLVEMGHKNVNRINFGGTPLDPEHYYDIATEMYFNFRELLSTENIDIIYDEELLGQLSQRRYSFLTGRRGYEVMKIESKPEMAKHATGINKSPDRADGIVLCYYDPKTKHDESLEVIDYNIF